MDRVHPDDAELFCISKKWTIRPWKDMEETYTHITKSKKSVWKGYILNDSNYMTFREEKIIGTVKKQQLPEIGGVGSEGMGRQNTEHF